MYPNIRHPYRCIINKIVLMLELCQISEFFATAVHHWIPRIHFLQPIDCPFDTRQRIKSKPKIILLTIIYTLSEKINNKSPFTCSEMFFQNF